MPPPPPHQKTSPPQQKNITVLLTGFSSFSRVPDNPSWRIVSSFISSPHQQPITFSSGGEEIVYTITLLPHPSAIKVCYATVDALIPELWGVGREWDYVLHLGVGLEGGYELERRAWEGGYVLKDVDGLVPSSCEDGGKEMTAVHGSEDEEATKHRSGRVLYTGLDVPWIVEMVRESVISHEDEKPVAITASDDPGMYLCGYIFRASLLEAEKRLGERETKRVAFLHVPLEGKQYGLQTGRDVVLKVVEGMVRDGEGVRE